jgi:hypothetical protein
LEIMGKILATSGLAGISLILASTAGLAQAPALNQPHGPTQAAPTNCTDVKVGSAQSYDCINAQLGAVAHATPRYSSEDAPLTSSSPSNAVGTFNEGATRNRLGANFGKTAVPYRPLPANPPPLPR